jgi:hypothetical protein
MPQSRKFRPFQATELISQRRGAGFALLPFVRGATIAPKHGPQCGRSGPPALSTLVIPCSASFTGQVTLRFTIRAGLQDFSLGSRLWVDFDD